MKKFIGFLILAVFSVFSPLLCAQKSVSPAIVKDWYQMLDTTFYWSEYCLPETTAVQRAQAMYLSWSEDSNIGNQLIGYNVYLSLSDLFFGQTFTSGDPDNGWYGMKYVLQYNYGINLDSAEASIRGLDKFSIGLNDNVSAGTLTYFSVAARKTPTIILPSMSAASYDNVNKSIVVRQDGKQKISGILMRFQSYQMVSLFSQSINWRTAFNSVYYYDGTGYRYSLGIIRLDGGYSSDMRWTPVTLQVATSYMIGSYRINNDWSSVSWADSSGNDHSLWVPSTMWRIYPRGDMNLNYNLSLGDAITGANMLFDGTLPPINNIMDITQDGLSDQNDLLAIFQTVVYGYWGGGGGKGVAVKNDASKDASSTSSLSGKLVVETFSRNGKDMVRIKLEDQIPGQSLGLILENAQNIQFLGDYVQSITVSRQTENSLKILRFTEKPSLETLLEAEVTGKVSVKPLIGNYFFSPKENIEVVYSTATSVAGDKPFPTDFSVSQNYPNPFNPTTKVSFAAPKSGRVTLKVYDMVGREVATLVDGEVSAGYHDVSFDASRLSSGSYIYRFSGGNFVETKKMILLK